MTRTPNFDIASQSDILHNAEGIQDAAHVRQTGRETYFARIVRARHFERGRACLHYWDEKLGGLSRQNVRRIGDQKSRNQGTVHVVSMTPFRGLTRFLLAEHYNCENGTFSNTLFHSPQGLPHLKRYIYWEVRLSLLVLVPQGYCSSLPLFRFLDPNFSPNTPATKALWNSHLSSLTKFASQAALYSSKTSTGTMHQANGTNGNTFFFTSESVGEGHPDKIADQV